MPQYQKFYLATGLPAMSNMFEVLLRDKSFSFTLQAYVYKTRYGARPTWADAATFAFSPDEISRVSIVSESAETTENPSLIEVRGQLSCLSDPGMTPSCQHFHGPKELNDFTINLLYDHQRNVGIITHGARLGRKPSKFTIGPPTLWFRNDEYNNIIPDELQHNGFPTQLLKSQAILNELSCSAR